MLFPGRSMKKKIRSSGHTSSPPSPFITPLSTVGDKELINRCLSICIRIQGYMYLCTSPGPFALGSIHNPSFPLDSTSGFVSQDPVELDSGHVRPMGGIESRLERKKKEEASPPHMTYSNCISSMAQVYSGQVQCFSSLFQMT